MVWQPKKLTREQMAERRAEGVRLLQDKQKSQAEIARELGITEAAVSRWKAKLEKEGPQALKAHRASGRPPKLNAKQRQALDQKLKAGALAAGFATEQWTQKRVKKVIEQEYGVRYHPNSVSRVLKAMDWSVQKPETRAMERDEALIAAWLKHEWPRIKKSSGPGR